MVTQGGPGGTERSGTGSMREATATGPVRAATATWEGPGGGGTTGTYAVIFCYCVSTFIFFSSHSSSVPIISLLTNTTTGGAQKESVR